MAPPMMPNDEAFDFGALISRLLSQWRLFAANALVAGGLMFGLTFLMPPWYRSTAVLLPPDENEQPIFGSSLPRLAMRSVFLQGLGNLTSPSDIYKAILSSRSVQQAVVERFGLQGIYRQRSLEKTLIEFRRHTRIALPQDGTISVTVEDRSRDRAAALANALVQELDRFNVERRNFQAKRTRMFLERRVAETDSLTRCSGAELRAYQETHHVVAPPGAESASYGPLAGLMARKMALEIRLSILRSYLREDNEEVVQVRTELQQLKSQIATMPSIGTELGRLIRNERLYQQLYVLLVRQLEEARIRETMDTPTITVLDAAVPAERRALPARRAWVAAAVALALLATALQIERPAEPSRAMVADAPMAHGAG